MAVAGLENTGWFTELGDIHLPGMRPEVKRTLIFLTKGLSRVDIARREGVEVTTIKGWIATGTAEIASRLPGGHRSKGELRGGWVISHLACCLVDELEACA